MEQNEAINDIMNDLLKINNDRIAGYEKAINESKDLDIVDRPTKLTTSGRGKLTTLFAGEDL
jgi:hypothetical protein